MFSQIVSVFVGLLLVNAETGTQIHMGIPIGEAKIKIPDEATAMKIQEDTLKAMFKAEPESATGEVEHVQEDFHYDKDTLKKLPGQNPIPSVMSMAFQHSTNKNLQQAKCRLPGLGGNVVRSFHNQGKSLFFDDETSLVELNYNLTENLVNETMVTGILYTQLETLTAGKEKHWFKLGWSVDVEIHEVTMEKWNQLLQRSENRDSRYKPTNNGLDDLLQSILARPFVARRSTINQSQSKSTEVLDVTAALGRMLKKQRTKFVMLTKMRRSIQSSFATPEAFCHPPLHPQLVVVTMDHLLCNQSKVTDPENNQDNPFLRRVKRGMRQERKQRRKSQDDVLVKPAPGLKYGKSEALASVVCQKHPMWVRFDQLGWSDWIIAPRAVQAYRCAGECPYQLGASLNSTNHALMMSLMNSVEPHKSPKPCCVPTKLKSVSILYLDNAKNVVLRQFEDMVIESCGCQ